MTQELSTTAYLITDVLAARQRLGEHFWTFPDRPRITKALRRLQDEGIVFLMHGITDNTVRAGLTEEGMERFLSPEYVPPILREGAP